MQNDKWSDKIVNLVIDLVKSFGVFVIVEGIEYFGEMNEIVRCGGEFGQGYYFGKVMFVVMVKVMVNDRVVIVNGWD